MNQNEQNKIAIILPTTLKITSYEDLTKMASFEESENLNYGLFIINENQVKDKLGSFFE